VIGAEVIGFLDTYKSGSVGDGLERPFDFGWTRIARPFDEDAHVGSIAFAVTSLETSWLSHSHCTRFGGFLVVAAGQGQLHWSMVVAGLLIIAGSVLAAGNLWTSRDTPVTATN